MRWNDYREKLGIGFSDTQKSAILARKIANYIHYDKDVASYTRDDFYEFCLMTGIKFSYSHEPRFLVSQLFENTTTSTPTILAYYIAFVNTQKRGGQARRSKYIEKLEVFLDELNILCEVIWDDDGAFVFPVGAPELDAALVSQPLEWLSDYPKARKTFVIALKQYTEGEYIRDVADNLRKALEEFLQEFLGNDKNLESNKNEICRYLGNQGVDAGISGLFQPLINAYKNINDRIAKHNDAVDAKMLEFLLYQTGLLIRMVLVVKRSNEDK